MLILYYKSFYPNVNANNINHYTYYKIMRLHYIIYVLFPCINIDKIKFGKNNDFVFYYYLSRRMKPYCVGKT